MTVYFIPQRLTLVERQGLDLGLESGDRCFIGFYGLLDVSAHIADGLSERIVVERFYFSPQALILSMIGCISLRSRCDLLPNILLKNEFSDMLLF